MKFGLMYEIEMPKPWYPNSEYDKYWRVIAQIQLADEVGLTTCGRSSIIV
jgi:hypothetical protein